MTRLFVLITLTLAGVASADPVRFNDLDINVDGRLELNEMELAFGENAPQVLRLLDLDGDGAVTAPEARAVRRKFAARAVARHRSTRVARGGNPAHP